MTNESPVALITGASRRIGLAIAKSLHSQGFSIIIHYNQNKSCAEEVTEAFNHSRANSAIALACDLREQGSVVSFAEKAVRAWGRVDVLVNNASMFSPDISDSIDSLLNDWQDKMDSNVKANFILCHAFRNSLKHHKGSIINLIDIYSERPLSGHTIYSTSKAACEMLTKSLALEYSPEIRVNGISPGAILWPENDINEVAQKDLLKKVPLNRLGSTAAIVETVNYLLKCDYITGQTIRVDGGRSITI